MKIIKIAKKYKGEANYAFSTIVTSGVSMVSGLVAAMFINPADLGVIQSILLISTYATFLNFGVFSGINRNLAFYKAKGDVETMQKEIDTSHSVSWIVAGIGFLTGAVMIMYYIFIGKSSVYIWSGILLLVTLVFTPITTHVECTFRSGQQFGRFGWIKNFQSVLYAFLSILPIFIGYLGRIIANSINQIFGYILRLKYIPYKHKGKGDWTSLKDLISTGFPIMINGYIMGVLLAADKTFIAINMSPYDMGIYTIAGYSITFIGLIPSAVSTMLYPRATAKYGETGDKKSLVPIWRKSILLYLAILLPTIIVAYFAMPPLVKLFMPKYVDGIVAGKIAIISCITLVSSGPSVIFGTLKKNIVYIIVITACVALFWLIAAIWRDFITTIEHVAILRGAISLILSFFTIGYSYYLIKY